MSTRAELGPACVRIISDLQVRRPHRQGRNRAALRALHNARYPPVPSTHKSSSRSSRDIRDDLQTRVSSPLRELGI